MGGPPGSGFDGPGQDGEKGLGATLVGGASGGFLAHKVGGGLLGSLAGAVAGAIGANALEHQHKKHKEHKQEEQYAQQQYAQQQYGGGAMGGLYPGYGGSDGGSSHHGHHHHHRHGSRSRSRSRGLDDDGSD